MRSAIVSPTTIASPAGFSYFGAMPVIVPNREEWFVPTDGLPRPSWPAIRGWMRAWTAEQDAHDAWMQITRHWLSRLRDALGGRYAVVESEHFHLVSALDEKARQRMLEFLERTRTTMIRTLGDVAWVTKTGKHVVMRFTDVDDYYAYIAHFYADGEHAGTGGVFLPHDYSHIAYPESYTMDQERRTLAHELAHNLLARYPLPAWLNEALAQMFDSGLFGQRIAVLDAELVDEHRAFWNAKTIQRLWSGRSFHQVESQKLSYSLAEVLLDVINREVKPPPEVFRRFVKQTSWHDAGQAAAREQLEVSLGEIASVFLGPGDWEPAPETWKEKDDESAGAQ
jgi:hypothetical protein